MTRRLSAAIAIILTLGLLAIMVAACSAEDTATTQAPTTGTSTKAPPTANAPRTTKTAATPGAAESGEAGSEAPGSKASASDVGPKIAVDPTLEPIVAPTLPDEIPGYVEIDPATGLHMTGTPLEVDFEDYRLVVSGKVSTELSLTYDEIRSLPKVTATPTLVCTGFFKDTATWSGASLRQVLELAGLAPDAEEIHLVSADGYSSYLPLDRALQDDNFLAYELEGDTLPVLHGFPLRAVLPDEVGAYWVKWLVAIEVE